MIVLNVLRRERLPSFEPYVITNRTVPKGARVLCVVCTHPANYHEKAVHVAATWAGRCDHTAFLSTTSYTVKAPPGLTLVELDTSSSRANLWQRVKMGIKRVWEHYEGKFDFLVKADDDTYIIVDNLKHRLQSLDPNEKLILGHYQRSQNASYMSGGSGYVISSAGVKSIVEEGLPDKGHQPCHLPHPYFGQLSVYPDEDLQMGACAKLLQFKFLPSEVDGKLTFLPFRLEQHLVPSLMLSWWDKHSLECRNSVRSSCASSRPISFHYVQPREMYMLDYLLYSVKVVGQS